jgi:hypothetical protein
MREKNVFSRAFMNFSRFSFSFRAESRPELLLETRDLSVVAGISAFFDIIFVITGPRTTSLAREVSGATALVFFKRDHDSGIYVKTREV